MKNLLTSAPILGHYNSSVPIELHTDASDVGIGPVLIQRNQGEEVVVAYASKTLTPAQRNYGATHLDLYAVVLATEKFQTYLSGNVPFKVVTDHAAIVPLLKSRNPVGRPAKRLLRISPYVFQVVYRPGQEDVLADASSRYPVTMRRTHE